MQSFPSLSNLTIVIFTLNRQRYVLRNLALWSATEATVHVLDGSNESIDSRFLSNLASNIKYHHLPVSIWERLAKGVNLVDTKYVAFLADDEFFIPSALEASISELEADRELVACCGRGIDKTLTADLVVSAAAIENNVSAYQSGSSGEVGQDDPVERMNWHMNPYVPSTLYAVCRSAQWRRVLSACISRRYSSAQVFELQFELSMSFFGKIKVLNELMWLRTSENPSHTAGLELDFDTWFVDPLYAQEVDDFLNMTARGLLMTGARDFQSVRDGLARACRAYVAYCAGNDVFGQSRQTTPITKARTSRVSVALKRAVKKIISRLPSLLLALLPARLRFRPYVEIAKALESAGLRVDWNQLIIILETVRKFHATNI
jgi:glycosyltransferase domain-containing protein